MGLALVEAIRAALPGAVFAIEMLGGIRLRARLPRAVPRPARQPARRPGRGCWTGTACSSSWSGTRQRTPSSFRDGGRSRGRRPATATWSVDGLMEISAVGVTKGGRPGPVCASSGVDAGRRGRVRRHAQRPGRCWPGPARRTPWRTRTRRCSRRPTTSRRRTTTTVWRALARIFELARESSGCDADVPRCHAVGAARRARRWLASPAVICSHGRVPRRLLATMLGIAIAALAVLERAVPRTPPPAAGAGVPAGDGPDRTKAAMVVFRGEVNDVRAATAPTGSQRTRTYRGPVGPGLPGLARPAVGGGDRRAVGTRCALPALTEGARYIVLRHRARRPLADGQAPGTARRDHDTLAAQVVKRARHGRPAATPTPPATAEFTTWSADADPPPLSRAARTRGARC